jgi:hypothetical protein
MLLAGSAWVWLSAKRASRAAVGKPPTLDFVPSGPQSCKAACDECGKCYPNVASVKPDWRCHDCAGPVVLENKF